MIEVNFKRLWDLLVDDITFTQKPIDRLSQYLLVAEFLREERQLQGLTDESYFGVVKSIVGTINELKGSDCFPEVLKGYNLVGNELIFLRIFEKYHRWLEKNNYCDEIDLKWRIIKALQSLPEQEVEKYKLLFKDKLAPFQVMQESILELMVRGDKQNKADLELIRKIENLGIAKTHLQDFFLGNVSVRDTVSKDEVKDILVAENTRDELMVVWKKISSLMKERSIKPDEILIVLSDIRLYKFYLKGLPEGEMIRLKFNYPLILAEIPIIKDFLTFLNVIVKGWQGEKVLQLLTSPFLTLGRGMSKHWLSKNLSNFPPDYDVWTNFCQLRKEETGHNRWDSLKKALDDIQIMIGGFPKSSTLEEFILESFQLFRYKVKLPKVSDLAKNKELALNLLAYNTLVDFFKTMKNSCELINLPQSRTKEESYREFLSLLKEKEIRYQSNGNIKVIDLQDLTRHNLDDEIKVLFILSLAEGLWPKRRSNNWVLTEKTRESLNKDGYPIKSKYLLMEEERKIFQQLLMLNIEDVYLSYPKKGLGKSLAPSALVRKDSFYACN